MRTLEEIYRFFTTIATIVKNIRPIHKAFGYIAFYVFVKLFKPKNYFFFEGQRIYFSNLSSTLASIEEIFFSKSLDFKTSKKNPIIIDAGANVGISAIYFKLLYPKAIITCIEPVPQTFANLKRNLKKYPDIQILHTAVGQNFETKHINIPKTKDVFDASLSVFNSRLMDAKKFKKLKVDCIKLSSIIKNQTIDCLILDIEGNEDKVLLELEKTKKIKNIKNIFVEYHAYSGNSLATITSVLERNEFEIVYGCGVRPPFYKYLNKFHSLPLYARSG